MFAWLLMDPNVLVLPINILIKLALTALSDNIKMKDRERELDGDMESKMRAKDGKNHQ